MIGGPPPLAPPVPDAYPHGYAQTGPASSPVVPAPHEPAAAAPLAPLPPHLQATLPTLYVSNLAPDVTVNEAVDFFRSSGALRCVALLPLSLAPLPP